MSWVRKEVSHAELLLAVEEVVGWQRTGFNTLRHYAYTPNKTRKAEKRIRDAWMHKFGNKHAEFRGEVHVEIRSWRELAKSNAKKRVGSADVQKPDVDNIGKLVLDALNHVAFYDDSQVTDLHEIKMPRIAFTEGNHLLINITYYEEEWCK